MESKEGTESLTIADLLGPMAAIFKFDLTEEGVLDLYETALAKLDMGLLQVTVSAMMDDLDWMPRPSEILRAAKKIEAASSDKPAEEEHWRKDRYDCQTCRDTVYVTIWTPEAMRWALSQEGKRTFNPEPKRRLAEAAAKCTCSRGQSRSGSAATFNPKVHVPVTPGSVTSKVTSLLEWAKGWQPANYVEAFEDF